MSDLPTRLKLAHYFFNSELVTDNQHLAALLEAADRLESLEREWVSVEDRLPEVDEMVLFTNPTGYMWTMDMDKDMDLRWLQERTGATHWMPLPTPPESE